MSSLLDQVGWRGCNRVLALLCLCCAFFGLVMRPNKKKRQPAVRRKKWIDLEQQQHNQCDQYDFDKAEEFLAYKG